MESYDMTTRSVPVSMSSAEYMFNQPFNPTLEGKNFWVLKIQEWFGGGCNIFGTGYWFVAMNNMVETNL